MREWRWGPGRRDQGGPLYNSRDSVLINPAATLPKSPTTHAYSYGSTVSLICKMVKCDCVQTPSTR